MKERPIIFSGPMVRAILDGRKTQTRRIVNPQPDCGLTSLATTTIAMKEGRYSIFCPYGQPGDRLWVRETFRIFDSQAECACYDDCRCAQLHGAPIYRADYPCDEDPWKPSIHMPRWASRITLEITGVRVERLNGISEDDACEEGVNLMDWNCGRVAFKSLWKSINGRSSWEENPWVWGVEFKRIKQ